MPQPKISPAILRIAALILAGGTLYPVARAQAQGASVRPASMRMYVFDCATLKDRDPAAYGLTREQVGSVDMSDPCFLIVHPKGTLLWETGLNDAIYDRPEGGGAKHDKIDKSLRSQLAAIGYGPADITYLAISHAHGDHSGNGNDYAGSTWIAQKAELEFMFREDVAATTSVRPDQFIKLKDSKKIVIDGDYDVFGDGAVTLVSTPGHTPGHQCLLVKLPKTGPVLLSGDLYHFPGEREFHTFPPNSSAQYAASRAKVEALIKSTGAQLWIQHDMIGNRKLKKSPEYYE
ncbi:MAG TPA: N-acyl homoserine lactonase family protein [Bryobacteraceae bacterium]|jgi:N-acyl homoserine lactone hydrolase|nr:N-acyl homoserine lactonase family protein [Bryobacteraceae bacterium]